MNMGSNDNKKNITIASSAPRGEKNLLHLSSFFFLLLFNSQSNNDQQLPFDHMPQLCPNGVLKMPRLKHIV